MTTLLSRHGSDRATAYITSNKIVRRGEQLCVGWLDAPPSPGTLATVQLGICNARSGELEQTVPLGRVYDNHCGPALVGDSRGRLHAILGAHHHPFLYRWSDTPHDPASWSDPLALGPFDTYPSLTVDAEGTLHLVHRKMEMARWELWYRRKPVDKGWKPWTVLAHSPHPGYIHFYQSLSIGPGGALHLLVLFHYTETGASKDSRGRSVIHLTSHDGGQSWLHEGVRCALPVEVGEIKPILHYPGGGLAISNHVVDAQDRLWFFAITPDRGGLLLRSSDAGWEEIETPDTFRALNFSSSRETSLTRTADGVVHLVTGTHPGREPALWHDPRHELYLLSTPEAGGPGHVRQLTDTGPSAANWLPALENWSWPAAHPTQSAALAWTRGNTAGRGNNVNALSTEVYFLPDVTQTESPAHRSHRSAPG